MWVWGFVFLNCDFRLKTAIFKENTVKSNCDSSYSKNFYAIEKSSKEVCGKRRIMEMFLLRGENKFTVETLKKIFCHFFLMDFCSKNFPFNIRTFLTLSMWMKKLGCEIPLKKSSGDNLSHLGDLESSRRPIVPNLSEVFSFIPEDVDQRLLVTNIGSSRWTKRAPFW